MLLDPNDLLLFARVAETGSFSRAAERVQLPKSTVSRRVSSLERQIGERLLHRTTRKLTLTDFGHALLEHARQIAAEAEDATALALQRQAQPSGRLRVTMPSDLATGTLAPVIADFVAQHEAITLEMDLTPRRVDLIGENFDLALRMGELPDDSTLSARKLGEFTLGLYASPAYLKSAGTPKEPQDLLTARALVLLARNGDPIAWRLHRLDARTHDADLVHAGWNGLPERRFSANSPEMLVKLACAGVGIAAVADFSVKPLLDSGELVRVLPQWALVPTTAWAVFPSRRWMPAKTRAFVDALAVHFDSDAVKGCRVHEEAMARALHA
jgi:DNA-binding transcriptional LysR family regulator